MQQLPQALALMANYPQFILCKFIWNGKNEKYDKLPINPHTCQAFTKGADWQSDPSAWTTAEAALLVADAMGEGYGVGFIFQASDPFFFVDIDNCLVGGQWTKTATDIMARLPGAAIELSKSGKGLHIFGQYSEMPPHKCTNGGMGLEFYHEKRFVALTGNILAGDIAGDYTAHLPGLIDAYFPQCESSTEGAADWTEEPVENYTSTETDEELIARAMAAKDSAAALMGSGISFGDLFEANPEALETAFPDSSRRWDESSADGALAMRLLFWTGGNFERTRALMLMSQLVRPKWDREDYLPRTIRSAGAKQKSFYSVVEPTPEIEGAAKLRGSPKAVALAEQVRAKILASATPEQSELLLTQTSTKLWLNNKDKTAEELTAQITPVKELGDIFVMKTTIKEGYQFCTVDMQDELFDGCSYIVESDKMFHPSHNKRLKKSQFDNIFAGRIFQLDGDKAETKSAWEAFLYSMLRQRPRVNDTCFRPMEPTGEIIEEDGLRFVNTYKKIPVITKPGDASIFTEHLRKLLPDPTDYEIMMSYMAACVQHVGCKFQWAPLLQGVEGNGKSTLTFCVQYAIGKPYTHLPMTSEIGEKYNAWAFDMLFIGVEDCYASAKNREVMEILKPMITSNRLAVRDMGEGQRMADSCANWILNTNHQDSVEKTGNDRRIAPFFCPQQNEADLERDGMGRAYFKRLYDWLQKEGGYAVVAHYLSTYAIPVEHNPAVQLGGGASRAPLTTSTKDAIQATLGSVEQEVQEAIAQGRSGFRGGWVSSIQLSILLKDANLSKKLPNNKIKDMLAKLGYIPHPGLKDGRATKCVDLDLGAKPRLFVTRGHLSSNTRRPATIVDAYIDAQGPDGNNVQNTIDGLTVNG